MELYSWYTGSEKTELGYKTYGESSILTPLFAHCGFYIPNRKGGHHHRRNYCICNVCGRWFRKNKGIHEDGFDFCGGECDRQASWEAYLEADVGGGFEPHFWED